MWSKVYLFHSIRYVGGADLWSNSRIVPAQPPSGMSGKSGSVVPGFTRTCAPLPKRAGVRGFFSFLFLPLTAIPPLSFSAVVVERWSFRTIPRDHQDGQARHGDPAQPGRRRGAVRRQRGTGPQQRAALTPASIR